MIQTLRRAWVACLLSAYVLTCHGELQEIIVEGKRVANDRPASSYATLVTELRYDPLTELQPRGLAEGQVDVTVRGSLFENTGFKLGVITLQDPQTGHYVAEVPVDPGLLTSPVVHKGFDNAWLGFNATVATISHEIDAASSGGSLAIGAGTDDLQRYSLRGTAAISERLSLTGAWSRSRGNGTVEHGDHEYERFNLLLQHQGSSNRSNLLVARQDKFSGWPGMYTGFSNLAETDETGTLLVYADHIAEIESGQVRLGAFYRTLEDDYDFDRSTEDTGGPGSFEHKTKIYGLGVDGTLTSGGLNWRYSGQFSRDELVRSTDLTGGDFDSREYVSLALAPSFRRALGAGELELMAALTWNWSSRDNDVWLPSLGVRWFLEHDKVTDTFSFDYTQTSHLPGYTALKSGPSGLFGGNPNLGREESEQVSLGWQRDADRWRAQMVVFHRRDDDAVDWTFASSSPFSRQANPVDLDVEGVELMFVRYWTDIDLVASYTHISKDADYLNMLVDGSFYALNFARDRATMALTWRVGSNIELRLDNEYRHLEDNPRRTGDDTFYLGSVGLIWRPAAINGLQLSLIADNLADSDVEVFIGTPPSGRQASITLDYRW